MADPRFYDNRGPFTVAEVCARAGLAVPEGVDGAFRIGDLASLENAGLTELAFCANRNGYAALAASRVGHCFVTKEAVSGGKVAARTVAIVCSSPQHAFAAAAALFYPDSALQSWAQKTSIDPSARIAEDVQVAPGVVIGPGAEIGAGTRLGPNAVIGRGVAIGRNCQIGSNATITHALLGDAVVIAPGTQIGQPGFGLASDARGHRVMPHLGRVILQDNVELGACCAIDRGALGDTVLGEGTKFDNLVHIAHNVRIGRHVALAGQVGIAGSAEIGDFVAAGGQVGIGDHAIVGAAARLAGKSGVLPGVLEGGKDYGGIPARPIQQWFRELVFVTSQVKRSKRDGNG